MKNMTRAQRRRQAKIRKMLLSLSLVLVIGMTAVGGTIAWLTATSETVTNTFTVGDISITLEEYDYKPEDNTLDTSSKVQSNDNYKLVPGRVLPKQPFVTVETGSEASWLFIKVEKTNDPDKYLSYTIDSAWTKLEGADNVYYREASATTAEGATALVYDVLTDNQVTVRDTVTKSDLNAIGDKRPTISFTAYAVQKENVANEKVAWQKIDSTYVIPTI